MRYDKEFILAEIRRTAREGVALGQKAFLRETGIKVDDWRGIHWHGWTEAIVEAGFPPNVWVAKIADESLWQELAELVRRIGRFPRKTDLQMERRHNPNFPSVGAFTRRAMSNAERAGKLKAHCLQVGGFADVVSVCDAVLAEANPSPKPQPKSRLAPAMGQVYLFKSGRYYKIGRSNSSGRRHYEVSQLLPEQAKVVHVINTDDPNGIEAYWHNRFASKRVRTDREWFDLSQDEVQSFKRM